MARGDKSAYTEKQQRKAEHIEEGYERRGASDERAERIAWATVNKQDGGGKKSGSGRGRSTSSGGSSLSRSASSSSSRSEAAKKGWATRRRKAGAKSD